MAFQAQSDCTRTNGMLPQSALRGRVIARLRLQDIITKDRAACGDGRWVRVAARKPLSIPDPMDDSGFDDWMREVAEWLRPVYRWEPRR